MIAPLEVGLCCADLDGLARFYVDVLGFEPVSLLEVPSGRAQQAALSEGSYRVARLQTPWGERLKLLEPSKRPQSISQTKWILERQNAAYLTFIVDDLAAILLRLRAAGAEILTGERPVEVRSGVWLAFAHDPEGNLLEFVEYDDLAAYRPDLAADTRDSDLDAKTNRRLSGERST